MQGFTGFYVAPDGFVLSTKLSSFGKQLVQAALREGMLSAFAIADWYGFSVDAVHSCIKEIQAENSQALAA